MDENIENLQGVAQALTGFGGFIHSAVDVLRPLFRNSRSLKGNENEALRSALEGNQSNAQAAHAKLVSILEGNSFPFIIRMGRSFELPAAVGRMQAAIEARDVWDWTFVTSFSARSVSSALITQLKKEYIDPDMPRLAKTGLNTTFLGISTTDLPKHFGDAIYIVGVVLGQKNAGGFKEMHSIDPKDFIPSVVIRIEGEKFFAYSDQVAAACFLTDALDWALVDRGCVASLLFDEEPLTEGQRTLSMPMRATLGLT